MTEAATLPALLDALNRKERFWLLRQAIGEPFGSLSEDFLRAIEEQLGSDVMIPTDPWWAFDYHLDWIAVALRLFGEGRSLSSEDRRPEPIPNVGAPTDGETTGGPLVRGSQQDADLLIAYGRTLIVVEAKAGTSWSRSQMDGKVERLDEIRALADAAQVAMHLVLCSPALSNVHVSSGKKGRVWPDWALDGDRARHVPLAFGERGKPLFHARRTGKRGDRYETVEFVRTDRP